MPSPGIAAAGVPAHPVPASPHHRAGPAAHPSDPGADTTAPKKQRHTAHRIWQRLRDEHAFTGGYTVVKDAVRELKVGTKEVFLPLTHPPGEAQVDFGFAEVVLAGVPTQVALFVMSLPYADAVYCQAFPRECTEVSSRARSGRSPSSAEYRCSSHSYPRATHRSSSQSAPSHSAEIIR